MKTFYSILYCTIRPNLDERISIGLFMANDKECYFHYSKDKLNIIKNLLSADGFQLLKSNLKAIESLSINCQTDQFNVYKGKSYLVESYFNYLSVYANNLLTYSKPTEINLELNQVKFNQLFEKFIYSLDTHLAEKNNPIEYTRKRLSYSIKDHVNFDVELTSNEIQGLIVPAKVTFIGKNDVKVAGEMNDFSKSVNFLKQQVNAHLYLVDKIMANNKNAKFFFIGDEPSKSLKENHDIWKSIKDFKTLDLISTKEIEKVEEYMISHQVEPLIMAN
ncbi:hypothetical protein N9R54_01310 [Pelobium sp.]|nr:hypothetical protein [Pelobium sp.]MDA9554848.1 hypothetical protein [Pelobium sp.]